MQKTTKLFVLVMLSFAMMLAACGGDDTSSDDSGDTTSGDPAPASFTVTMHDIYYGDTNDNATNPPSWTASAGARAQIEAINSGGLEHNWAIMKAGATIPETINDKADVQSDILYDIGNVAAGESLTGRFDVPEAGEYTIICTVAGHYPSMQGKLYVNE